MAKDRICEECPEQPIIKGKSWSSHCFNKHSKNRNIIYTTIEEK
jgi:hypothetical protein